MGELYPDVFWVRLAQLEAAPVDPVPPVVPAGAQQMTAAGFAAAFGGR